MGQKGSLENEKIRKNKIGNKKKEEEKAYTTFPNPSVGEVATYPDPSAGLRLVSWP